MGEGSIWNRTVDICGHLFPGANVCLVDRLDEVSEKTQTTPQRSVGPAQPGEMEIPQKFLRFPDLIGGVGWTRTNDLRIMSSATPAAGKEDKAHSAAESGKALQNPQPQRNRKERL